jgi:hypothetical protein
MPRLEGMGYRSQEGEEPVVGAPWCQWERGGGSHGTGGTLGRRRRERRLWLAEGEGKGCVAGGLARHASHLLD